MRFFLFSRFFKVKGNNNVSGSSGTTIDQSGMSEYCRNMIYSLMDENHQLHEQLRQERLKNKKLMGRNKKLNKLLKEYISDEHI